MLHAIIMAGGAGTRFWPESRTARPKQLLNLLGPQSMLQATIGRLGGLISSERTLIVTSQALVSAISQQLPELSEDAIVGEPCKRDTAPCIGLAAALLLRSDKDATMVVMPADHVISPDEVFQASIEKAVDWVEAHPRAIATFGIRPTYPAESFGYIERAETLHDDNQMRAFRVRMFREKPTAEVAEQYLASGNFYWNSGIFVWKARTILDALQEFEPQMHGHLQTIAESAGTDLFSATLQREFTAIQGKSIDYAVMEHYDEVLVIEAPFQWDDVGSWRSLARMRAADDEGNTIVGNHLGLNTHGCIVRSDERHLVVTVGLEDCIVVHTPDATLVARKRDEESIRTVVEMLKEKGLVEYL